MGKFHGAVINERNLYFIPDDSDVIGVLSVDTHTFSIIPLDRVVSGFSKFSGAVVINHKLVFSPSCCGIVVVLDTITNTISKVNICNEIGMFDYGGCIAI